MRKAIVLTAFNREDYLIQVLRSWDKVRGLQEYDFFISIDPSEHQADLEVAIAKCLQTVDYSVKIIRHPKHMGVLKHPLVVMDYLFREGYEFVIRVEDDLVVSDGILEYYNYAIRHFSNDPAVVTIHGYSHAETGREHGVVKEMKFNPWVFGTWNYKWDILSSDWDQDYSTFTGFRMNQSGFDWNFNLRVYPEKGLYGVFPEVSRVKNIGAYGVHGTPELLPLTPTFKANNVKIGDEYDLGFRQFI